MSKTLEQMAKKYVEQASLEYEEAAGGYYGFIAGYQAAKDQLADTNKVINGNTSDGYHTFNELYEHRHYLFIALMYALQTQSRTWISSKHADKSSFDGSFIAGINLPTGPITYHLPNRLWIACVGAEAKVLDQAPPWDGHTSTDVLNRLARYSAGICDEVGPPFVDKVINSSNNLNGWISVKERLPKIDQWCSWWDISGASEPCTAFRGVDDIETWWKNYTHWMPLPKPPEAKE